MIVSEALVQRFGDSYYLEFDYLSCIVGTNPKWWTPAELHNE